MEKTIKEKKTIIVAVDQGNYNVKTFGPGRITEAYPTGLNHHGEVPPPIIHGSVQVGDKHYSLSEDRLQARRDKTEDEDYYVLTLVGIARELKALYKDAAAFDCNIALALGLPVEHLTLKSANGELLRDKYRRFFGNNGKPIEFFYEKTPFKVTIKDVGVFPQSISAALSNAEAWKKICALDRAYVVDIGGGTANIITVINRQPQNPGVTLEGLGVLGLFKMINRSVMEDCGINLDDFRINSILRGSTKPKKEVQEAVKRAKQEYIKRLMNEISGRIPGLEMEAICFVGGGSILLYDVIQESMQEKGNDSVFLVNDIRANAHGYYLQEKRRLEKAGEDFLDVDEQQQ